MNISQTVSAKTGNYNLHEEAHQLQLKKKKLAKKCDLSSHCMSRVTLYFDLTEADNEAGSEEKFKKQVLCLSMCTYFDDR